MRASGRGDLETLAHGGEDFLLGGEQQESFANHHLAIYPDGEFSAIAHDGFHCDPEFLFYCGGRTGCLTFKAASPRAVTNDYFVHVSILS